MEERLGKGLEDRLRELYGKLEASVRARAGSDRRCGMCYQCCTVSGRRYHRVAEIELAFLEANEGSTRIDDFRAYVQRVPGPDGDVLHPVCPYYDVLDRRCSVYASRPFSCRSFGHWRAADAPLPQECVFEGTEEAYPPGAHADAVPFARDLAALDREWRGGASGVADAAALPPVGSLDRAMYHVFQGEPLAAQDAFRACPREPEVLYQWGMFCLQERRLGEAVSHFRAAANRRPESAEYTLRLGQALLQLGRAEAAYTTLVCSAALDPSSGEAHALLGQIDLSMGRVDAAVRCFEEALRREPGQQAWRLLLESARVRSRARAQAPGRPGGSWSSGFS